MTDLVGCTIVDKINGRRGVIISVVSPTQVFVQWQRRHCTTVTVEAGRFDVITTPITKGQS